MCTIITLSLSSVLWRILSTETTFSKTAGDLLTHFEGVEAQQRLSRSQTRELVSHAHELLCHTLGLLCHTHELVKRKTR